MHAGPSRMRDRRAFCGRFALLRTGARTPEAHRARMPSESATQTHA